MNSASLREAVIDISAISANVELISDLTETDHFLAVVKADGYGHGAAVAARAAMEGGADWLGVIDGNEAAELRAVGIEAPILTWLHSPFEDFATHAELGLDVGVSSIDELNRAAAAGVSNVQIKVDTGLSRNGVVEPEWDSMFELAASLQSSGGPRIRGIFSHLANAGVEADSIQLAAFERASGTASAHGIEPELLHLAATAGAIGFPASRFNLVRVGIGCYGLSPFSGVPSAELGLKPAMQLRTSVVSVRRVPSGSGVSYGHRYRTDRETSLALIPLGYVDGLPRSASNRAKVWINEEKFKVSGTIAMDQLVVDVGDSTVRTGDQAVIFGDPLEGYPSADDWADAAETINYEIVARVGSRVQRRLRES